MNKGSAGHSAQMTVRARRCQKVPQIFFCLAPFWHQKDTRNRCVGTAIQLGHRLKLTLFKNVSFLPPMLNSPLAEIEENLRSSGFQVEHPAEGGILVRHPQALFAVVPFHGGAYFHTYFLLGAGGKNDRPRLLAFLNKCNKDSTVVRFSADELLMSVAAWYPGPFVKDSFDRFLQVYLYEMEAPRSRDSQIVSELFSVKSATPDT